LIALVETIQIAGVNGTEPKIEIFKPFGEAFELMKKILFQPFDLTKWLVIGFAAFLASFSGGVRLSFNPFSGWSGREDRKAIAESFRDLGSLEQVDWWVFALIVMGGLIILALVLVFMWLGARGQFIFTDCIVHNRGGIVAPWKEFRAQGNSFFLFSLLVAFCVIVLAILAALALFLPAILTGSSAELGVGFWIALGLFIFFMLCLAFGWMLIMQLMVPIMYRQRCLARPAFGQSLGLIAAYPGPMLLYLVFLLVILFAVGLISCLAACVTCCIAAIPYIGTVILLPIPVTLHGFSFLFLRQFGSDYDVWANFIPSEFSPILLSPPAPPTSTSSLNPPPAPPTSSA
jgi:hypothetical protein